MAEPAPAVANRSTCQVRILTWNLENLFHPDTGGPRHDHTPREGWTLTRYHEKVRRLGHAMTAIMRRTGRQTPFILGLSEVEGRQVVNDLLAHLPKRFTMAVDPSFTHIYHDTVLLYDSDFFTLEQCTHHATFRRHERGDVIQADFRLGAHHSRLSVVCCHLKARPDNQYYTATYREAVCDNLQNLVWRLHDGQLTQAQLRLMAPEVDRPAGLPLKQHIVLMGDFNDEPFSPSMTEYLMATYDQEYVATQQDIEKVALYNCAWEGLHARRPGSLYYKRGVTTKWGMLDQIIISPHLLHADSAIRYVPASFAVIQDVSADRDGRPWSCATYGDDGTVIWCDGYSDHFPVWIALECDQ